MDEKIKTDNSDKKEKEIKIQKRKSRKVDMKRRKNVRRNEIIWKRKVRESEV
jgi:hypothetical protein